MRVYDYQAIKYIQQLMLDPEYISYDSKILNPKNPRSEFLWRWKRIALIKQVIQHYSYFLKDAKDIVDYVIYTAANDEELFKKFQ